MLSVSPFSTSAGPTNSSCEKSSRSWNLSRRLLRIHHVAKVNTRTRATNDERVRTAIEAGLFSRNQFVCAPELTVAVPDGTGTDEAGRDAAASPGTDVLGAIGVDTSDGNAAGETEGSEMGVTEGMGEDRDSGFCV